MLKKELELEEKINLVAREVSLLEETEEKVRLDLEEAVDNLRLEIESVKITLRELVPNFHEKFNEIKETVLREIDPEWINRK